MYRRGLVFISLITSLSACGGSGTSAATPPEPVTSVTDMFPVDPHGSRYHPMHRAAFGPIRGGRCSSVAFDDGSHDGEAEAHVVAAIGVRAIAEESIEHAIQVAWRNARPAVLHPDDGVRAVTRDDDVHGRSGRGDGGGNSSTRPPDGTRASPGNWTGGNRTAV